MARIQSHSLVLLILFFFGCKNDSVTIVPVLAVEYQIYATVIDSLYKNNLQKSFVIPDRTAPNNKEDLKVLKKGEWVTINELNQVKNVGSTFPNSDFEEMSDNYEFKNRRQYKFHASSIKSSCELHQITSDSLKTIFTTGSWTLFHKIFPNTGGLITFSRIGFSKNNNWAVLYTSCTNGFLNGEGRYILLKQNGTGWQIKAVIQAWQS